VVLISFFLLREEPTSIRFSLRSVIASFGAIAFAALSLRLLLVETYDGATVAGVAGLLSVPFVAPAIYSLASTNVHSPWIKRYAVLLLAGLLGETFVLTNKSLAASEATSITLFSTVFFFGMLLLTKVEEEHRGSHDD